MAPFQSIKYFVYCSFHAYDYRIYSEKILIGENIFCRLKSGNPGYLVAYQSGSNSTVLDLSKFDKVSDEVVITALSSNYNETGTSVK